MSTKGEVYFNRDSEEIKAKETKFNSTISTINDVAISRLRCNLRVRPGVALFTRRREERPVEQSINSAMCFILSNLTII